jgi:hypothetical protein
LHQKGTGKIRDYRGKTSIKPVGFIGRPFGQILLTQNLGLSLAYTVIILSLLENSNKFYEGN